MDSEQIKIPQATAKRLPLYYRFIKNLSLSGKQRVSSAELSEAVKVDSATIRRDFSYFGALGKKGYGYNVNYLLTFFSKALNQHEVMKVALIGVGNLGTAFLHYNFIKNNNTKIEMAFDIDPNKIGTEIGGVPVYNLDNLEEVMNEDIQIVILTVPAPVAQSIADRLNGKNIRGILNFTPARISVPEHIRIHHIDLAVELQTLAYFLQQ
ncbi:MULTISPECIES: redox-sensing transcriptional repressor Rex [Bacillaceae]|jgi:redox-sensing transcriptional repressor|uniref:Redox-sensing transcriptional repressor Rex n=2 Tax=Gottfriedia TaxID=2837503 RepID=A0ABY4JND7_9BACI|nr:MULTISPECIES: redox-sensing transcriptional repressor Rex [Bacillaceae]ODG91615.1 redox-sensing transcriptional repressor Rex [Gottfriedia luciferensis]PEC47869.1 redox-sensing transcriptional repressor Rex [Bacillus sp. AFS096315]PET76061.1 redox-sensing transcriptional repressor Rex [Bacillus sp. AFS001701]PFM76958.1 redox-sensing transcriptional repressor Rex [Bacillus sp. AFS077874]PGZ87232.1 redox-sensing transcriptional repressor Rex [Bacillus sp. AFS029533]